MPREDRRIIFDYSECYQAIYALCVQKEKRKPPPGAITSIWEDEKDETRIFVRIENQQDSTDAKLEYSRDFIAAAVMVYCRGCGIPLPKRAQKSVVIGENDLILRAQVD